MGWDFFEFPQMGDCFASYNKQVLLRRGEWGGGGLISHYASTPQKTPSSPFQFGQEKEKICLETNLKKELSDLF